MIGNTGGVSVIEMIIVSLACSEVSGILLDNFYSIRFFRLHFPKHQVITKKKKSNIFQSRQVQNHFLNKIFDRNS